MLDKWRILSELVDTLYSKSQDYGPEPIYEFGYKGTAIRIASKITRCLNLIEKARAVGDESTTDTLIDILGYIVLIKLSMKGEL